LRALCCRAVSLRSASLPATGADAEGSARKKSGAGEHRDGATTAGKREWSGRRGAKRGGSLGTHLRPQQRRSQACAGAKSKREERSGHRAVFQWRAVAPAKLLKGEVDFAHSHGTMPPPGWGGWTGCRRAGSMGAGAGAAGSGRGGRNITTRWCRIAGPGFDWPVAPVSKGVQH